MFPLLSLAPDKNNYVYGNLQPLSINNMFSNSQLFYDTVFMKSTIIAGGATAHVNSSMRNN